MLEFLFEFIFEIIIGFGCIFCSAYCLFDKKKI